MLWALFYGVLIRLLIGTKAGKQYPWILKVSHVFLAIGMGIGAQILGSTPDQDHVHKLNFGAAVMIIPQMLNSLILAVALTISPHATGKMFGKLFMMMGSFASAAILGAIYQQPRFSPIIVVPTGLVAAGWCLMLNHDRRLMDCLKDFKEFNHTSKLKLQGWLFPSIWLLPFVFVGIVGLAVATIAASIAVFILIVLIAGALASDGDKNRRNTRQRRANDELAGGMVEAGGEGCMAGSCFAFVIFGNLIQCITMQETCRTKYLDYKCD